jgi:hypothetical protein
VALLALIVTNLWFKSAPQPSVGDVSLAALRASYARILPGETQTRDLAGLGFDVAQPGVRRLSYLSLMEAFAPRDSNSFDQLDAGASKCLALSNGCSAYVFRLARASGDEQQASFSFINDAQAGATSVEVLFLIHDGRVAYKAISGI